MLVLPFGVATAGSALLEPATLALGLAIGVLSSALPYSLDLLALRRLSTAVFGVLTSLNPAAAAVAGLVVLGELPPQRQLVGIALVVVASVGVTATRRRRSPVAAAPAATSDDLAVPATGRHEPHLLVPPRQQVDRATDLGERHAPRQREVRQPPTRRGQVVGRHPGRTRHLRVQREQVRGGDDQPHQHGRVVAEHRERPQPGPEGKVGAGRRQPVLGALGQRRHRRERHVRPVGRRGVPGLAGQAGVGQPGPVRPHPGLRGSVEQQLHGLRHAACSHAASPSRGAVKPR